MPYLASKEPGMGLPLLPSVKQKALRTANFHLASPALQAVGHRAGHQFILGDEQAFGSDLLDYRALGRCLRGVSP